MDIYNAGTRIVNTYVYRVPAGWVMIDTGYEHSLKNVEKKLSGHGISMAAVKYVFLTHAHDDHAGFLNELLSKYPGIQVIASGQAMPVLFRGENSFAGGCSGLTALLFCKLMGLAGKGRHVFPPVERKNRERLIEVSPSNAAYAENLLQGKILFTPGHTSDSISLKIGNTIFCGDAAMNGIPSVRRIVIWIEDKKAFQDSWNILIDEKADWIYPAHGKPFKPADLKKYIHHIQRIKLYKLS